MIEHADILVTNGSYGVFGHCVVHGIPMVLSGDGQDKPEVGLRGEYAGFALSLGVGSPTAEMLAASVAKVLAEPKYKRRAMELKKEAEDFKCFETVERELRALF